MWMEMTDIIGKDIAAPVMPDVFLGSHGADIISDVELGAPVKKLSVIGGKVTASSINYVGSVNLPTSWFNQGLVLNGELVRVFNESAFKEKRNGANPDRNWMTTYALRHPDQDFTGIMPNGGAAQRIMPGDIVGIHSFMNFKDGAGVEDIAAKYIWLDADNIMKEIKMGRGTTNMAAHDDAVDRSYIPMYSGKLHRIIRKEVPEHLKGLASQLDEENHLTMLVDKELGRKAGFKEGQAVDFLMIYKNVRESVRVKFTNISGHMSLHGRNQKGVSAQELSSQPVLPHIVVQMLEPSGEAANPDTTVVVGYKMMPYAEASKFSDWINENGYPNLVIFDSLKSKPDTMPNIISDNSRSFPYTPGIKPPEKAPVKIIG